MAFFQPLTSTLLCGLLAAIITIYINYRNDSIRIKRNLANDLLGYRYQLSEHVQDKTGFFLAMNRIPIIFDKDKRVLDAHFAFWSHQQNTYKDPHKGNELLIALLQEVCKASKIRCSHWDKEKFTYIFR